MRNLELRVSAFTVRVPVLNCHAETVWVTLKKEVDRPQILETLKTATESSFKMNRSPRFTHCKLGFQVKILSMWVEFIGI